MRWPSLVLAVCNARLPEALYRRGYTDTAVRHAFQGFAFVGVVQCIYGVPAIYSRFSIGEFFNPSLTAVFGGLIMIARNQSALAHTWLWMHQLVSACLGVIESLVVRYLSLGFMGGDRTPGVRKALCYGFLTAPMIATNAAYLVSFGPRRLAGITANLALMCTILVDYRRPTGSMVDIDRYFLLFVLSGGTLSCVVAFLFFPTPRGASSRTCLAGAATGGGRLLLECVRFIAGPVDDQGRLLAGGLDTTSVLPSPRAIQNDIDIERGIVSRESFLPAPIDGDEEEDEEDREQDEQDREKVARRKARTRAAFRGEGWKEDDATGGDGTDELDNAELGRRRLGVAPGFVEEPTPALPAPGRPEAPTPALPAPGRPEAPTPALPAPGRPGAPSPALPAPGRPEASSLAPPAPPPSVELTPRVSSTSSASYVPSARGSQLRHRRHGRLLDLLPSHLFQHAPHTHHHAHRWGGVTGRSDEQMGEGTTTLGEMVGVISTTERSVVPSAARHRRAGSRAASRERSGTPPRGSFEDGDASPVGRGRGRGDGAGPFRSSLWEMQASTWDGEPGREVGPLVDQTTQKTARGRVRRETERTPAGTARLRFQGDADDENVGKGDLGTADAADERLTSSRAQVDDASLDTARLASGGGAGGEGSSRPIGTEPDAPGIVGASFVEARQGHWEGAKAAPVATKRSDSEGAGTFRSGSAPKAPATTPPLKPKPSAAPLMSGALPTPSAAPPASAPPKPSAAPVPTPAPPQAIIFPSPFAPVPISVPEPDYGTMAGPPPAPAKLLTHKDVMQLKSRGKGRGRKRGKGRRVAAGQTPASPAILGHVPPLHPSGSYDQDAARRARSDAPVAGMTAPIGMTTAASAPEGAFALERPEATDEGAALAPSAVEVMDSPAPSQGLLRSGPVRASLAPSQQGSFRSSEAPARSSFSSRFRSLRSSSSGAAPAAGDDGAAIDVEAAGAKGVVALDVSSPPSRASWAGRVASALGAPWTALSRAFHLEDLDPPRARFATLSVAPHLVPEIIDLNALGARVGEAALKGQMHGISARLEPELYRVGTFFPSASSVRLSVALDVYTSSVMELSWIAQNGRARVSLVRRHRRDVLAVARAAQRALEGIARVLETAKGIDEGLDSLQAAFEASETLVRRVENERDALSAEMANAGARDEDWADIAAKAGLGGAAGAVAGADLESSPSDLAALAAREEEQTVFRFVVSNVLRIVDHVRIAYRCLPAVVGDAAPDACDRVEGALRDLSAWRLLRLQLRLDETAEQGSGGGDVRAAAFLQRWGTVASVLGAGEVEASVDSIVPQRRGRSVATEEWGRDETERGSGDAVPAPDRADPAPRREGASAAAPSGRPQPRARPGTSPAGSSPSPPASLASREPLRTRGAPERLARFTQSIVQASILPDRSSRGGGVWRPSAALPGDGEDDPDEADRRSVGVMGRLSHFVQGTTDRGWARDAAKEGVRRHSSFDPRPGASRPPFDARFCGSPVASRAPSLLGVRRFSRASGGGDDAPERPVALPPDAVRSSRLGVRLRGRYPAQVPTHPPSSASGGWGSSTLPLVCPRHSLATLTERDEDERAGGGSSGSDGTRDAPSDDALERGVARPSSPRLSADVLASLSDRVRGMDADAGPGGAEPTERAHGESSGDASRGGEARRGPNAGAPGNASDAPPSPSSPPLQSSRSASPTSTPRRSDGSPFPPSSSVPSPLLLPVPLVFAPLPPPASIGRVRLPAWLDRFWKWLQRNTFWTPHGFRAALHVVIAWGFVMALEACDRSYEGLFEKPLWAAIAIITQIDAWSGVSARRGLFRVLGTAGGALGGMAVTYIAYGINGASYANSATKHAMVSLFLAIAVGYNIYLSAAYQRYAYVCLAAHMTLCMTAGIGYVDDVALWKYGLWRTLVTIIGASAYLVIVTFVLPARISTSISNDVAGALEGVAAGVCGAAAVYVDEAVLDGLASGGKPDAGAAAGAGGRGEGASGEGAERAEATAATQEAADSAVEKGSVSGGGGGDGGGGGSDAHIIAAAAAATAAAEEDRAERGASGVEAEEPPQSSASPAKATPAPRLLPGLRSRLSALLAPTPLSPPSRSAADPGSAPSASLPSRFSTPPADRVPRSSLYPPSRPPLWRRLREGLRRIRAPPPGPDAWKGHDILGPAAEMLYGMVSGPYKTLTLQYEKLPNLRYEARTVHMLDALLRKRGHAPTGGDGFLLVRVARRTTGLLMGPMQDLDAHSTRRVRFPPRMERLVGSCFVQHAETLKAVAGFLRGHVDDPACAIECARSFRRIALLVAAEGLLMRNAQVREQREGAAGRGVEADPPPPIDQDRIAALCHFVLVSSTALQSLCMVAIAYRFGGKAAERALPLVCSVEDAEEQGLVDALQDAHMAGAVGGTGEGGAQVAGGAGKAQ